MLTACGVIFVFVGLVSWLGQLISSLHFPLAQRWGLQESEENSDAMFSRLERNAARWDLVLMWSLPAAGALILARHGAWPHLTLFAGGVYLDAGGRELAKLLGLRAHGIRMGTEDEARFTRGFLFGLCFVGLLAIGVAGVHLPRG